MKKRLLWLLASSLLATSPLAAADFRSTVLPEPVAPGPLTKQFVKVPAGRIALRYVRVIDGTGKPARANQTVLIEGGKIVAIQPATKPVPKGATVLDLPGHTVFPGLVGMHDHLFYVAFPKVSATSPGEPPQLVPQMTFSSPRLYLAGGVTTLRTTGSVEPYADLNLKRAIDKGEFPGPHIDVTGPYLEGKNGYYVQMPRLNGPEAARATVAFWADQGATSFKAYTDITRAELKAATEEAHRRGLKITGHFCSVTYPEAVEIGVDNLEHGFFVNTQLDPGKKPDVCSDGMGTPTLLAMKPGSPEAGDLIKLLVAKKVAVTSTLAIFEQNLTNRPQLSGPALDVLSPQSREAYFDMRKLLKYQPVEVIKQGGVAFQNDMQLERAFVAAGGLLLAGSDPTGIGGAIPGFANQRGIELLVEAGFTPEQAIRIATLNGAIYLGLDDRIGSLAPGKNADIVVVSGNPSQTISDVRNVKLVFKDGVGYDPAKLLESVRGRYGEY